MSRTRQALKLMEDNPDLSQMAAAKAVGITQPAISEALKRRKATIGRRCPVCDSVLPYLKHVIKD